MEILTQAYHGFSFRGLPGDATFAVPSEAILSLADLQYPLFGCTAKKKI